MSYYILIESSLFNAQMKGQLKNKWVRNGFYMQDTESTIRIVNLISDGSPFKDYNVISWEGDKPSTVLARYKTTAQGGSNYKTDWIMTEQEFLDNVNPDIEHV